MAQNLTEKAVWSGELLWGNENYSTLHYMSDLRWMVSNPMHQRIMKTFSEDELNKHDANWKIAFTKIYNGLQPSSCACSCGAMKVMGGGWDAHDSKCDHVLKPNPFEPRNNDGRTNCFKCGHQTKSAGGGSYSICNNSRCGWNGK